MKKIATREAYGKTLATIVSADKDVLVLDADLSKSTKTNDAKVVSAKQHFNMGIAEANMMSVAAGMAANGKTVFASTFAMFAAGRAYEQIRNSIGYPHLNVKVCATHAGISVGEDGASHQAIEDLALMRSIPNMVVLQPCDANQTEAVIKAAYEHKGPVYVRLGRLAVNSVYSDVPNFTIGKGDILKAGKKVAIITTGMLVQEVLSAAASLEAQGYNPTIVNFACIKPIDKELIVKLAQEHELIITVEEHNVIGGLGSAVSEVVCQSAPVKMQLIGINDEFGQSGKPNDLIAHYGLDAKSLEAKIIATYQAL